MVVELRNDGVSAERERSYEDEQDRHTAIE